MATVVYKIYSYDRDSVVDTLRECRSTLRSQNALDADLELDISNALGILGVDDAEES